MWLRYLIYECPENHILISDKKINQLKVDTRFRGTRENPEKRGAILNVGADNFTFGNVCYSFLSGICEELYGFYSKMRSR